MQGHEVPLYTTSFLARGDAEENPYLHISSEELLIRMGKGPQYREGHIIDISTGISEDPNKPPVSILDYIIEVTITPTTHEAFNRHKKGRRV